MQKLRVGVLFGGRSGEHEVSLLSAASVLNAIDKEKYEVVPIGITKDGRWLTAEHAENLLTGKLMLEPRNLRAGDPDITQPAAVLARWRMSDGAVLTLAANLGEAAVSLPPPAGRMLFESAAGAAKSWQGGTLAPRATLALLEPAS